MLFASIINLKVWQQKWPKLMKFYSDSCMKQRQKLLGSVKKMKTYKKLSIIPMFLIKILGICMPSLR